MDTLLLDQTAWDLVLDANGNVAVAADPYSLAQDAASACKTFLGEVYLDAALGVPWVQQILSKNLPSALVKQKLIAAALTVPDVVAAQFFIESLSGRLLTGQVQVASSSGDVSAVPVFTPINPQGQ